MDKFERFFKNTEDKSVKIQNRKTKVVENLIYEKLEMMSIEIPNNKECSTNELLLNLLFHLRKMPNEFNQWLKNDILKSHNTTDLLVGALIEMTCNVYSPDKKKILYSWMKSLKEAELLKSIHYEGKKQTFKITMNNDKTYKIEANSKNFYFTKKTTNQCHLYTEMILRNGLNQTPLDGCCIIFKDFFNNPHFHSFCIRTDNNIVIDPSHNIMCDLDFYTEGLKYEILFRENGSEIIKNIDYLNTTNKEFRNSPFNSFIKYASLQGDKNNNNQKILKRRLSK